MGAAGGVASGVGGFLGAVGSLKQAKSEERTHNYNAEQLRYNARAALEKAKKDEETLRISGRKQMGEMRANYGASGVQIDGSALDILEESAVALERDALNIRFAGEQAYYSGMNTAIEEVRLGHEASEAGYYNAVGSMLGGASGAMKSGASYGNGGGSGGSGGTSMGGGSYFNASRVA